MKGYVEGATTAASQIINDIASKFEKSDDRTKIEMVLAFRLFYLLEKFGIIKIYSDGSLKGFNRKRVSFNDIDQALAAFGPKEKA